ncbi:phosphoribosylaminoimidazolesuccinocarboxamide synthase [Oceanobacillus alkalisoli]|uniref:phosphoribosylaminoimidazolesuccinocarboxamide synthase n=1 Tax=Oceanobacillus alkalisoli TaxID=2925113 RepID=UPI001EF157CC|nr:phosphoribosylaminoimidazolesuccinocarboxamide synthase [Oceanobacillus alkalisoli]MCF3943555.1 phosphoribosylaminoimidazolesuccinocarboxamide synthase [Oceanobacillus alkalisoli]MCG5102820.1 phosphoribosylaminoimidazolesuccinocarboxamide synthase [Oceanobacillus alkalisoli]
MKLVYEGKTKDVYEREDGNYLLKFKDDVTGEGGVFDPGANTVGLTLEGAGRAGLELTTLFFEILKERNIPTHYVTSDLEKTTMTVIPADAFGDGLEVICRYRAAGSFLRRYGKYAEEGQELETFVEVTLKDDQRNDPPIGREALSTLGILSGGDYETLRQLTIDISDIIKEELAKKNIELYDVKLEFGRDKEGNIILIDEISGGNMRVYRDEKAIDPIELAKIMTAE